MNAPLDVVAAIRECPTAGYPALLQQAIEDPAAISPRRALADAMRADGVDWAELIDLQLAWDALSDGERDRNRGNLVSQAEILRRYPKLHRAVAGELGTRGPLKMGRGLVEHATIEAATLLASADELFAQAPITSLSLFPVDDAQAPALAGLPEMSGVRRLHLAGPAVGDAGVTSLVTSPTLANLVALDLYDAGIGDGTVKSIATGSSFHALARLAIADARLSGASMDALARGDRLTSLRQLALEGRWIDERVTSVLARSATLRLELLSLINARVGSGLGDLAGSPVIQGLRTLILTNAEADPSGAVRLIASLGALETLHLEGCKTGNGAAAALQGSRAALRSVALRGASLDASGARTLAEHASDELWRLDLALNAIGDDGAGALGAAAFAPAITRLALDHNGIGAHGVAAIAAAMPSLVDLNLSGNPIGDEGARLLADAPALRNVERLVLLSSGVGPVGARALLDSPNLERARRIVLPRDVGPDIRAELRARAQSLDPLLAI